MQLIEYSTQRNYLAAPLKCRQLPIQQEHHANTVFSYLRKLRFWHHLQQEVHVSYREETQNVKQFTMENPVRTKANISHTVSIKHNALKCSLLSIPHKEMI